MNARPGTERFTPDQLLSLVQVGRQFWNALANDDDATLLRILTPHALDVLSTGQIPIVEEVPSRPDRQLAERIRDFIGFSADDCRAMGAYTQGTCLGSTAIRILYMVSGEEPLPVPGSGPFRGRRIEFELADGRWLVEPTRAHDRPAIEMIDLKPLLGLPPPD